MSNNDQSPYVIVRQALIGGIPVTSILMFIAVTIKVFRAAHMETSTTVAVVSSADVVALVKGVVVTLLPGFLASLIAAAIWLWVRSMPADTFTRLDARGALFGPRACLVWLLLAIGFFTIPFIVFILILIPVAGLVIMLMLRLIGRTGSSSALRRARQSMVVISLVTAVTSTGWLAISPDVWLPLRDVHVSQGHDVSIGGSLVLHHQIAAYVLDSNPAVTTLLVDQPRAVITVSTSGIEPNPAICIPPPSRWRWLMVRTSQRLGIDGDYPSPYPICPTPS